MKRPLLFLAIFCLCCWTSWGAIAYLSSPLTAQGQLDLPLIIAFFVFFFGGVSFLITFSFSAVKATRPNQKLPKLLVQDSLIHGLIVGAWATGLLVLQLLRVATWLNLGLWLAIILSIEWLNHEYHKNQSQPS